MRRVCEPASCGPATDQESQSWRYHAHTSITPNKPEQVRFVCNTGCEASQTHRGVEAVTTRGHADAPHEGTCSNRGAREQCCSLLRIYMISQMCRVRTLAMAGQATTASARRFCGAWQPPKPGLTLLKDALWRAGRTKHVLDVICEGSAVNLHDIAMAQCCKENARAGVKGGQLMRANACRSWANGI